jgi:hypothetical protein
MLKISRGRLDAGDLSKAPGGRLRGLRLSKKFRVHKSEPNKHPVSGDGSKPWYLVNPKIAGEWMFIPLKMYL